MADLILWATMAIATGAIGMPLARIVPARLAWRRLLAPTLGTAMLAVLVPALYRLGVSMRIQLWIWMIGALAALVYELPRARPRPPALVTAACVATALVLLAPRWVGGDQFAVFQGNTWDNYAYVEGSLAYATHPYRSIHDATEVQQLRNPFFANARSQLEQRPAVDELYALFSRVEPGQAYRLYYAFLVFFMAQLALVGMFVVRNALPRAGSGAAIAIALASPLGFWGQYAVDIDAWSQVASAPLLFAVFGLVMLAAGATERREAWRLAAAIAIAVAGSCCVYPEGLFIYGAAVGPVAVAWAALAMRRARRFDPARVIPLAGFAGVAAVAVQPALASFITSQLGMTSKIVPWWTFFQRFFIGRDDAWGDGFARASDFIASLFGCYFATPASADALVVRIVVLVGLVGLVVALVRMLREPIVAAWTAVALLLLAPAAWVALHANYWVAGKLVSYAAPVFVTALALPFVRGDRWRWFAGAYVTLQLGCGVMRIPASRWDSHCGYASPYPSIQVRELKRDQGWDLRGLEPLLDRHSKLQLDVADTWIMNELMSFCTARGIPYVTQYPVTATPGGVTIGQMPMPWTPNVELTVERNAFVLHYPGGRSDVRVPSR